MDQIFQLIWENKEWLFSGIGVAAILVVGRLLFGKSKGQKSQTIKSGDSSINIQAGRDINYSNRSAGKDEDK